MVEKVVKGELYWWSTYLIRADEDSSETLKGKIIAAAEPAGGDRHISWANIEYVQPFDKLGYIGKAHRVAESLIMDLFKRNA